MTAAPLAPEWSIGGSYSCDTLAALGLTCMTGDCDGEAVGHAHVVGGPFDGRVLLVLCATCIREHPRVKVLLAHYATLGLLNLQTGGPGPHGEPEVVHGDHVDPLPRRC